MNEKFPRTKTFPLRPPPSLLGNNTNTTKANKKIRNPNPANNRVMLFGKGRDRLDQMTIPTNNSSLSINSFDTSSINSSGNETAAGSVSRSSSVAKSLHSRRSNSSSIQAKLEISPSTSTLNSIVKQNNVQNKASNHSSASSSPSPSPRLFRLHKSDLSSLTSFTSKLTLDQSSLSSETSRDVNNNSNNANYNDETNNATSINDTKRKTYLKKIATSFSQINTNASEGFLFVFIY
jgi:hypothetical protein